MDSQQNVDTALAAATKLTADANKVIADAEMLRIIVRDAVSDALIRVGLDTQHAEDTRADLMYLRQWRTTMETVRTQGVVAAVRWLILGLFALIVIGLGAKLGIKPPA